MGFIFWRSIVNVIIKVYMTKQNDNCCVVTTTTLLPLVLSYLKLKFPGFVLIKDYLLHD